VKLRPDTKDALMFCSGLMGFFSQIAVQFLGGDPSWPVLVTAVGLCGIPVGAAVQQSRKDHQEHHPKRRASDEW